MTNTTESARTAFGGSATENSAMFSLGALVRSAPTVAAEPEETPQTSLRDARFVAVLATPVAVEPPRVGRWVIAAGLFAMLAPIAAMVIYVTRAPARTSTTTSTFTSTSTSTSAVTETETATATATATATVADAPREEPNVHHKPRTTITTATTTARPREAPKCCPGETEMACAMRRSVGAACGG